jgi:hypothetical protein
MDNLIYHFTTKYNLRKILSQDRLKVSKTWIPSAISLTRDKNLHKRSVYLRHHNTNAVIILDKDKLKCRYKLIPFDFFGKGKDRLMFKEAEEVILKDILNIKKYIIEIRDLKNDKTIKF